ncbi:MULTISPECIES: hypothetical protein [Streptomyces]|uniref:Uncharacterized protein n=1 Tax=Streptomyces dengpaensis TaxID=2049881 RepID=A0ABN5HZY8_9ACTN|nr:MULTISPECIES: hypothetical protein [Streptomyces]AVH54917.1 hypothetical protein C4B68_02885 [Streptomyces dengpaensis]PIB08218.1 hypothetical protein B1C81_14870 [Streptomyces sp. HG99]
MSEGPLPASQVQVVLSDCSAEDAGRLFAVLCGQFSSDRCAEDEPHERAEHRPTVWSGTFDTATAPKSTAKPTARLSGPVSLEAQGTPGAVQRLRDVLDEAFTVQERTEEAGDQEVQVRLRVDSTPAPATGVV